MTKKEMRLLILLGISIILANLVLRLILRPLPENIGYLIKTLGLTNRFLAFSSVNSNTQVS